MDASLDAMHRTRTRRATAGFTLMELLLVVVIIGILGALALPRVNRMTRREKVNRATQVIQGDIERAFALAARLRKPVRFVVTGSSRTYQVIDDVGGTVRFTRQLARTDEAGVDVLEAHPSTITIRPNGIASDTMAISVSAAGTLRQVVVTRVGLVRRTI